MGDAFPCPNLDCQGCAVSTRVARAGGFLFVSLPVTLCFTSLVTPWSLPLVMSAPRALQLGPLGCMFVQLHGNHVRMRNVGATNPMVVAAAGNM